jgi:hypothetical protein
VSALQHSKGMVAAHNLQVRMCNAAKSMAHRSMR